MILGNTYVFWIFFLILGITFYYFPQLDIWFSSLFFENGSFYLKEHPVVQFVYDITHPLAALFFLAVLGGLLYSYISGRRELLQLSRRALAFLLIAFILAPGVVVNLTLKDHVDRARPKHVTQFGGDKQFTPAFVISDQCEKNCSFVCGHAAAGFSFVALAMVLHGAWRRRVFYGAVVAGFGIGLVRVIQGGHFLSDVFFSFFFTYLTIQLLHYWMFRREGPPK